jgi:hypothetical protein
VESDFISAQYIYMAVLANSGVHIVNSAFDKWQTGCVLAAVHATGMLSTDHALAAVERQRQVVDWQRQA